MRKISAKSGNTNPLPPGTQNVPINMSRRLAAQLTELGRRSNMSRSAYCVHYLNKAAESGQVLRRETIASPAPAAPLPVAHNDGNAPQDLSAHADQLAKMQARLKEQPAPARRKIPPQKS
jgi:hypothetical protein